MKRYFAAINEYANESSRGFANTWSVLAFTSKKARDEYVDKAKDLATCAILKKDIGRYIDRPKPFSGLHWAIMNELYWEYGELDMLGYVDCVHKFTALNNRAYKGRVYSER